MYEVMRIFFFFVCVCVFQNGRMTSLTFRSHNNNRLCFLIKRSGVPIGTQWHGILGVGVDGLVKKKRRLGAVTLFLGD